MNGMFYKIAAIGALIWFIGMIIAASGMLSLQLMGILTGSGAIIGGAGIILVGLGFFAIWKTRQTLFPLLAMIFAIVAGILMLVEGILAIAVVMALIYVGAAAGFTLAAFFVLAGIVLHDLEATAKTMFLHEAAILSLVSAVAALSVLGGGGIITLALLPVTLFYVIVFFKM